MALTDESSNGMIMPVQPMYYGNGCGGFGNGFGFGGDWSAIIILFLFAAMFGGFGNGFGGNGGNSGAFPWLLASNTNSDNLMQSGFNQAAIAGQLNGIQSSITNGFASTEVADCNRAMNSMQTAYTNQIADLERSYAAQTANTAAISGLSSQLASCCCENRLATANLSALVQSENCSDRAALSDGIRDIITAQSNNTQKILDVLCQDKIDAKNERIQELQTQLNMQNLAASQAAQTAALIADNNGQTRDLINRIAPYPQPAYIVGNPYYSGCGCQTTNCGCGVGGIA